MLSIFSVLSKTIATVSISRDFSQIRISDLKSRYKSRYGLLYRATSAVGLLISHQRRSFAVS